MIVLHGSVGVENVWCKGGRGRKEGRSNHIPVQASGTLRIIWFASMRAALGTGG